MPMTPRLARWIRDHYPGRGELIVARLSHPSVPLQDEPEERIPAAISPLGEGDPRRFQAAAAAAPRAWPALLGAAARGAGGGGGAPGPPGAPGPGAAALPRPERAREPPLPGAALRDRRQPRRGVARAHRHDATGG